MGELRRELEPKYAMVLQPLCETDKGTVYELAIYNRQLIIIC